MSKRLEVTVKREIGILDYPKVMGSNLDLAFSNPGRVKPMTLKLILVTP